MLFFFFENEDNVTMMYRNDARFATAEKIWILDEGMEFNPFGQGYGSMSAPSKEFEKLVLSGRIEHFGNPVLRLMLASTVIKTDPASDSCCPETAVP